MHALENRILLLVTRRVECNAAVMHSYADRRVRGSEHTFLTSFEWDALKLCPFAYVDLVKLRLHGRFTLARYARA